MKDTLKVGDKARLEYKVPADKTVPHLYPESHEFQQMPTVFATGFMVGLMEWTCLKVLEPHMENGEGSLGVHVNVSHVAPTVPGQVVTVDAECMSINGRRVGFKVSAHDGVEMIGEGTHERIVISWERFVSRVNDKAKLAHAALIERVGTGSGVVTPGDFDIKDNIGAAPSPKSTAAQERPASIGSADRTE